MAIEDCNADVLANALFTSLTADAPVPPTVDLTGETFTFAADPNSGLYDTPEGVTLAELTECDLKGEGVFDSLMSTINLHIDNEFQQERITGDEYAAIYASLINSVLSTSTQFLLNKDQARWAAITAQMQARIAEIQATEALINLEKVKVETQKAIFDMQNSGAEYALTKMKVANQDAEHCLIKEKTGQARFQTAYILPAELAIQQYQANQVLPSQVAINNVQANVVLPAEAAIKQFENTEIQPIERDIQQYQLDTVLPLQTSTGEYTLNSLLPVQLGQEQHKLNFQLPAETALLSEQKETARASTLDTRSDGITPIAGILGKQAAIMGEQYEAERAKTLDDRSDTTLIVGSIGKQKDLYTQQIDSFVKDAQHKTAKMYLDSWITQKTLDEGLLPPTQFENAQVEIVLAKVRDNNGLTL